MCVCTMRGLKRTLLNSLKEKLGRRKTFTAYKVLDKFGQNLYSSYGIFNYKQGTNRALAKGKIVSKDYKYGRGNAGIHVYKDKNGFECQSDLNNWGNVLVEITCHIDDVLAIDYTQIALSKVYISKSAWKKAGLK